MPFPKKRYWDINSDAPGGMFTLADNEWDGKRSVQLGYMIDSYRPFWNQ